MIKSKENGYASSFMLYTVCFFLVALVLTWGSNSDAQLKLKAKKVQDICYECHEELKKNLSDRYIHFLFKGGKCITCHNSHVSNVKGLMNDEVNTVCLDCHKEIRELTEKATMHSALRDSICTDCHFAHSGNIEHLIVTDEKKLCLKCHEDMQDQMDKAFACQPFKEGKCSACHNSHGSYQDNLLLSNPNKLCQECHGPKCKAGDVSISSKVKNMDCTSCHSGHSSSDKGILGPYGHTVFLEKKCEICHGQILSPKDIAPKIDNEELCFACHKKDDPKYKFIMDDVHVKDLKNVKNSCTLCHDHHASGTRNFTKNEQRICIKCHEKTEKRTALMEKALKIVKCAPIKNRKCFACHVPTHSDRPLNFVGDEIQMCANCHASQHKITHPLGADVIDPRNGKSMTCLSCHNMHSARERYLLPFERTRALCIQCHKL